MQAMVKSGLKPGQVYAAVIEKGQTRAAPPQPAAPQQPAGPRKVEVPADAPVQGEKTAKVTIVEWSDFECPFCSRVEPTLAKVKETYGKNVRIVWRNQPLPFHSHARLAATAVLMRS